MVKLSELKADASLETEGVWVTYERGVEFRVARTGTENFNRTFREQQKRLAPGFRVEKIPDAKAEEIMIEVMARTILLEWRGIEVEDGEDDKPLHVTRENARLLLSDRDIRDFVLSVAQEAAAFRRSSFEDDAGN